METATETFGSLLIPIIMSKLPNEMRLHISRQLESNVWDIKKLLGILHTEIDARETSENVKITEQRKQTILHQSHCSGTASALFTRDNKTVCSSIQCVYCKEMRYSSACDKIKDVQQRKLILQRDGRWFLCIKTGHRIKKCQSPRKYRNCRQSHHQSICQKSAAGGESLTA